MLAGLNLCIPFGYQWKILFALAFIPLALNLISLILLPESPMYYLFVEDDEKALEVLKSYLREEDAEKYLKKLKYEKYFIHSPKLTYGKKCTDIFTTYLKPLSISIGLVFFLQLVGSSAFLYYGADIFMQLNFKQSKKTDSETEEELNHDREITAILLTNFIIGVYVFGYLMSMLFINLTGRRMILLISLPCAFYSLLALAFTMQ